MNKRSVEESKEKILAAARTVFAQQGYLRANMRTIGQEAEISVGGLYLYFRNKEELYLALMQGWMDTLRGITLEALARKDDPSESLRAFIDISIDFARTRREMIVLQGKELGVSFGIELKRRFFMEQRQLVAGIITRGIESGVFRRCNVDEAAKVIFNVIRGFVFSMIVDDEVSFSSEECVDLVLNGLLRRNDG